MAPAGGTELNVFQVSRRLAQRGHVIDLVSPRDGSLADGYRTFCRSVSRRPVFDFARATAARDLVRMTPAVLTAAGKKADVIYPNRFAEIVWAAAAGSLSRTPVVCHLHEIRHGRPGSFPNKHVRRFIAVSDFLRRQWVEVGLNPDIIDVVHNGVSSDDYPAGGAAERAEARARLGLPQEGFVALYYGRLDPEKGIDVLLEAWRKLDIGNGEGTLLVVGSPSAHLENGAQIQEALQADAPPGCLWRPAQSDVVMLLHAADVVVVPSLWDEPCAARDRRDAGHRSPRSRHPDRRESRDADGRVRAVPGGTGRRSGIGRRPGATCRLAEARSNARRALHRPCAGSFFTRSARRRCGAIAYLGGREPVRKGAAWT